MSDPGVKLRDFKSGPESLTVTPGENGLAYAVGAVEPLSAGEVPVIPDLVEEVARPYRVRSVRARSGELVTGPLRSKPRPRFRLGWTTLTAAERATLVAFFRDAVQGTRLGFEVRVDGPGTPLVKLRLLADPSHLWKAKDAHGVPVVEVEEIF